MPSNEYVWTGQVQKWRVPTGVKLIEVVLEGAGSAGRGGGRVTGRMSVTPGNDLFLYVGRAGQAPSGKEGGDPVFGGGGRGGTGTSATRRGGYSGGGGTYIRSEAPNGPVRAAAGGAGGTSGDGGVGGRGGHAPGEDPHGEIGFMSDAAHAPSTYGRPTGGTQNQGGRGGNTSAGPGFSGADAAQSRVSLGGRGGQFTERANIYGGGGGGGGYYSGGGGAAGIHGVSKGGGGAGGSNYMGGLFNATTSRGGGGSGNGLIRITWDAPGGDTPPAAPNVLRINGVPIADGLVTRALNSVVFTGMPNDPDKKEEVRLFVRISENSNMAGATGLKGTYDQQNQRDQVVLRGLKPNTRYYLRVHTQQQKPEKLSTSYTSTNFWTNRSPNPPALISPFENSQITEITNVTFEWNHSDPDEGPDNTQSAYEFRYRRSGRADLAVGSWKSVVQATSAETRTFPAGTFGPNYNWDWQVRTRDQQGSWGAWSETRSFFIIGVKVAPTPYYPTKDEAAVVTLGDVRFSWRFRTKQAAEAQVRVDLRYRVVGTTDWQTVAGDEFTPGKDQFWNLDGSAFEPGFRYEWQVRTYTTDATPSDWSEAASFWASRAPGYLTGGDPIDSGRPASPLGEGINRAYIYDRGGLQPRGEIRGLRLIRWNRVRDDISEVTCYIDEPDIRTRALLNDTHTWRHEIVVFRTDADGKTERVWEGPITRKSSSKKTIEIAAKDVLAWPYRRIMRQGYSDAYQIINGEQTGRKSVVDRAAQILLNALIYDDPNILGYLTPMVNSDDARSSRTRADYSRMAWEEIDDLAAVAGLDYTAVGRRIILNDTHRAIGKLPEMTERDFTEPPVITEYGMSAAYYFAVTNGSGVWGAARASAYPTPGPEGWIEQLASAYGEDAQQGQDANITVEQQAKQRLAFTRQAGLNVANRYPIPVLVRVPDNSQLSPNLQVNINSLVPGVWIPLRADNGMESISQWQKLDSITVEATEQGEKVSAVMSPAPNSGVDLDAEAIAEGE